MTRVSFVGVKHGEGGDGFFGIGIDFDGGLEFSFRLLHIVVEAVEAAEEQVIVNAAGIQLSDLLVLIDSKLKNVVGAGASGHIAKRAQVNTAEKFVGLKVLGIALDDVLGFADGVGNASGLHIELGEGRGQELRRGIGLDCETVFLGCLCSQVAAAVGRDHFLVHVRQAVVVVRGGLINLARRGLGRLRFGRTRFRGRLAGLGDSDGGHCNHQKEAKKSVHPGPDCACCAFPKP